MEDVYLLHTFDLSSDSKEARNCKEDHSRDTSPELALDALVKSATKERETEGHSERFCKLWLLRDEHISSSTSRNSDTNSTRKVRCASRRKHEAKSEQEHARGG